MQRESSIVCKAISRNSAENFSFFTEHLRESQVQLRSTQLCLLVLNSELLYAYIDGFFSLKG
jgi:hypothetical protein